MNALHGQLDISAQAAHVPAIANSRGPQAGGASFAAELGGASGDGADAQQQAREAATQFVATAFIMPVLAMMHDSPFATEPFAPNSAQKRFMPMLDWQIADRVTNSANFPLVDRIVDQMTQHLPGPEVKGGVDVRG